MDKSDKLDLPEIISASTAFGKKRLDELSKLNVEILDVLKEQIYELFRIRFPSLKKDLKAQEEFFLSWIGKREWSGLGSWVYYPWRKKIVHVLEEDLFFEVITARNKPLISPKAQKKLREMVVGVAGLSVGSNIVQTLAYSGVGKMKLADPDTFDLSNLNRLKANITDLGENKTFISARMLWEINPYIKLWLYPEGINANNLEDFLMGEQKVDYLFDEVDNLALKFQLRLAANACKLPLIMVTDNGYSADLDIIRFDQEQPTQSNSLPRVSLDDVKSGMLVSEPVNLSIEEEQALIDQLLQDKVAPEMKKAAKLRMEGQIAGWPQLGLICQVGSGLAAYALALMSEGEELQSGKMSTNLKILFSEKK